MKTKIATLALALGALLGTGLASCTGDYAQPPVVMPEGGIGTGAWDDPMTAYQALLGSTPSDRTENWVKGYIVGWIDVNVTNVLKAETARFDTPATVNTNILIAPAPDCTDWTQCVPVQLPSGAVRDALNLAVHPDNVGKLVSLYGTTGSKYCSIYGVRSVMDYNWGEIGIEPDPAMVAPEGSREVWSAILTSDMQGFTLEGQQTVDATTSVPWSQTSSYGLVASGLVNRVAYVTDAWAISPVIDLAVYKSPRLLVNQAANYFGDTATFLDMTDICVREEGGEWLQMQIPIPPAGNSWNFIDSGYIDLDLFAGKKIQIGFNYISTTAVQGSWEIKKVTVTGVPGVSGSEK